MPRHRPLEPEATPLSASSTFREIQPVPTSSASAEPLFTVVSACYQVASFLDEFIASIEAQDLPPGLLEVVMVDDGSSDATPQLLDAWASRRPDLVRVLRQANGGQGSARNAGMAAARGEWVTFPDPDDVLDPDYFSQVRAFLDRNPTADMVATNRWLLNDSTKELTETHPLRKHFTGGDVLRNLAIEDRFFHGSSPAAFFRRARIRELGLTYDTRIRPNFEDGHFSCRYLLELPEPKVGFVSSARYQYRKRQDQSSTLQNSMTNPGRFSAVLRYGYLDVLTRAAAQSGPIPLWLQNFVIYELSYYLGREDSQAGRIAPASVRGEFHDLMAQIVGLLDPWAVTSYAVTPLRGTTRDVLLHGYRQEPWVSDTALISDHDPDQSLVQLTYRFTGPAPEETVELGTRSVLPHAAKTRDVVLHDRTLLSERILWVPARRVRLRVGDRYLLLADRAPEPSTLRIWPSRLPVGPEPLIDRERVEAPPARMRPADERRMIKTAGSRRNRRRFADAWVLMDRIHNADDSAEHLFSWLRERRPGVNAYFVIERDTPDWHRLRAQYGDRVIAHGSEDWTALMLNAAHLISSHADVAVCLPPQLRPYRPWPWRFTFLQHGVIKDDLSGWLNSRPIDLFITSTLGEHESVVGEHTTYRYTEKETALTGLPRFDLLHSAAGRIPSDQRDLVLISPTWRMWLVPPLEDGSQRRGSYDWFAESEYCQAWLGLLRSPELERTCREQGLTIALLPHPNMEAALADVDLPAHVTRFSFDETDVRELFARAAVLVTDYSSTAFNAAYIERPVVYFQFDRDQMLGGDHVGRPGYFDYQRDGFGPVAATLPDAVEAIIDTLDSGRTPTSPWQQRIHDAFPYRDDQCRKRVFNAITALGKPRPTRFADEADL